MNQERLQKNEVRRQRATRAISQCNMHYRPYLAVASMTASKRSLYQP